jgi:hypothetical protein
VPSHGCSGVAFGHMTGNTANITRFSNNDIYRVRHPNLTFFERLVYEGGASCSHGRGTIESVRFCSFSYHGAVGPSTPSVRRGDVFLKMANH